MVVGGARKGRITGFCRHTLSSPTPPAHSPPSSLLRVPFAPPQSRCNYHIGEPNTLFAEESLGWHPRITSSLSVCVSLAPHATCFQLIDALFHDF